MKLRRLCCLALTLALLLTSLLTGSALAEGEYVTQSGIEMSAPGEFPITKEKTTITVFIQQLPYHLTDITTNSFTQEMEELTNVHLNMIVAPSDAALLLKYLGTSAVTVTLMTVFLFLGPSQGGDKSLLSGENLYMHLIGPVLAIVSYCFLEKRALSFATALTGLIPVAAYGAVYLYKVILAPEAQRWEDFYGFNRGGKWPVSMAAMFAGAFLVSVGLWLLGRMIG